MGSHRAYHHRIEILGVRSICADERPLHIGVLHGVALYADVSSPIVDQVVLINVVGNFIRLITIVLILAGFNLMILMVMGAVYCLAFVNI